MPTGYTAELINHGQSFDEFVMGCARAFGALVSRDSDAPIPETIEADVSWHDDSIARAKALLADLDQMSLADAVERQQRQDEFVRKRVRISNEKAALASARLEAMVERVNQWEPPTPEHAGLKEFMLQQLQRSRSDGEPVTWGATGIVSPQEYMDTTRVRAERDIAYHTAERQRKIEQAEHNTAWVRALRASL